MPGFVIDGSVALAAALPDEQSDQAGRLLERVAVEAAIAPVIWPFEVANGLMQAQRRGRVSAEFRLRRLLDFSRLPVTIDSEGSVRCWADTSRLAAEHGLTVYDSSYLELAIRALLPLATFDKALVAAARRERVVVL